MEINYWTYQLPEGFEALAGKTDADNDLLTIKIAKPNDYWFHVAGSPGSHVILRHPKRLCPSQSTLYIAASIAAWHSKERNNKQSLVKYTLAKNVTKSRGSAAGSVFVKKTKIIKVNPKIPDH